MKNINKTENTTERPSQINYSIVTSIKIGAVSGAMEGAINHPLLIFKIWSQNNQRFTLNPRFVYRGLPQNVLSVATIISIRITTKDQVIIAGYHTQTPSFTQSIIAAFCGGLAATPISSIVELGITQRQKDRKNVTIIDTCSQLIKENGLKNLLASPSSSVKNLIDRVKQERKERPTFISTYKKLSKQHGLLHLTTGMPMIGIRDTLFCIAFMGLAPAMKEQIVTNGYTTNNQHALIFSSITLGLVTAIFAHPADTIAAIQHKRASNADTKEITAKNIAKEIMQKDGLMGFYRGIFPRGARIASAVFIFNKAAEELGKIFQPASFTK